MCSTPLNPNAESWIPQALVTTSSHPHQQPPPPPDDATDMFLMYPHEFFSTSASSTLLLSSSVLSTQPFQQLDLMSTTPNLFHGPSTYYKVFSYNDAHLCNNISGRWCLQLLQPQPYPHAVLPLFTPSVPLISWRSTNAYYEVENGADKKKGSKICCRGTDWRTQRFGKRQNKGRRKSTSPRQEWKPKKSHSDDDGVISSADAVIVSSSPYYPTKSSSMADFQRCMKTTVMIRNIPNLYRRSSLMQFLDLYCKNHNLEYDFFYLPMDFRRKDNLGYAFVNFTTPAAAAKIMDLLEGFEWFGNRICGVPIKSRKICATSWADIQGKNALVKSFQNSNFVCDDTEYLPVILSPPRNGSEEEAVDSPPVLVTLGKLKGPTKCPRLPEKASKISLHLTHHDHHQY